MTRATASAIASALALALAGALAACGSVVPQPARGVVAVAPSSVGSLRFIGEQRVAHFTQFHGTVLGGFSGMDYDAAHGRWVIGTDDRCARNPARFYEAALDVDAQTFRAIEFLGLHYFRHADGKDFAVSAIGCKRLDVEAIRIDPQDGSIWYSSEGDRRVGLDPFIFHGARDGAFLAEMPLPPNFRSHQDQERGARYNASLEGLAFAADGRSLWAATEWPLYEDGPIPTPRQGAHVRMTEFLRDGQVLRQFAYPLDAIPAEPAPGKASENGVSEILAMANGELLVLERAAVQGADGRYTNSIRLYAADARQASDTKALAGLAGAQYTPARKRLVLDLGSLGLAQLDNVEAMAWGPRLPNGRATLVLASDDNFSKDQVSQFLLFEVLP